MERQLPPSEALIPAAATDATMKGGGKGVVWCDMGYMKCRRWCCRCRMESVEGKAAKWNRKLSVCNACAYAAHSKWISEVEREKQREQQVHLEAPQLVLFFLLKSCQDKLDFPCAHLHILWNLVNFTSFFICSLQAAAFHAYNIKEGFIWFPSTYVHQCERGGQLVCLCAVLFVCAYLHASALKSRRCCCSAVANKFVKLHSQFAVFLCSGATNKETPQYVS